MFTDRVRPVRSTLPPPRFACVSSLCWRISARCTGPLLHSVGPLRQPGASLLFHEMKKPCGGVQRARAARVGEALEVVGGRLEALPVSAAVAPEGQVDVAAGLVKRVVPRLLE